ncbi:hypothetical protein SUGI_0731850 [Cryptomeria japonica]|nr:hypothetical protein SUGI_0731850 [Cryptomeria japonica]
MKRKHLASMNGLRYLCFKDTIIMEGDLGKLSPDLKWLKWERCSLEALPTQWNLEHLAILDLSSRSISHGSELQFSLKQLWNEQLHRKMPRNLRVLRVNWCPNLQRLPTFSTKKSLLKLDLRVWSQIKELPDSLVFQRQLYYLELSCCCSLEKLPDCIGSLLELKHLDTLEGLKSLKVFELRDAFDIGDLPQSIGSLSQLEKLDLESCLIVTLPASAGLLRYLRCLNMNRCEFLFVLPDEIGSLESLEELLLNKCENLTTIPSNLSKLQSLVRFEAGYCDLKSIPESFRELSSLKILHLEYNKFTTLPLSCAAPSQLTELVLCECTELVELPILPEGLVTLDIEGCQKLNKLPKMAHLKRMQMLKISRCSTFVQTNILWEVRTLTLQIRHGDGIGETVRLSGHDSWNDHFREYFEVRTLCSYEVLGKL